MAWNNRKPQVLNRVVLLPVADIRPNPHQPRKVFDPDALDRLARSIAANGLLQPISVRDLKNGSYELVSGERRLLAYQSLGQRQIPAIILDCPRRIRPCWPWWKTCTVPTFPFWKKHGPSTT